MANKEVKAPVPFSVMNGDGEPFEVQDKQYIIKPMLVGDALKFADEGLSVGSQIINLANDDTREKLDKYLSEYCFNKNGQGMSIEKIINDKWSVVDLKNFVRKMVDISG